MNHKFQLDIKSGEYCLREMFAIEISLVDGLTIKKWFCFDR
jgi:hypothetical protein